MKTPWVIGAVVAAHIVAVAGVFMIQGCGTARGPATQDTETGPAVVMPPSQEPVRPVVTAPVTPEPKVDSWPAATQDYVVAPGDTLSDIAARHGLSSRELARLNGLDNADMIMVGQKLKLPGNVSVAKPETAAPSKPAASPVAAVASGDVYVVKKGDTLSHIAVAHGCKVQAIRDLNGLTKDTIYVGQKLRIPGGRKTEPTVSKPTQPASAPAAPAQAVSTGPLLDSPPAREIMAPAVPEATSAPTMHTHIVKADEDIFRIAMLYHVKPERIREVNHLGSGRLTPGQRLMIPVDE